MVAECQDLDSKIGLLPTSNEQEVEDKADKRVQQLEDHRRGEVEGDQQTHWRHAFTAIRINFKIGWAGQHDKDAVAEALDRRSTSTARSTPPSATAPGSSSEKPTPDRGTNPPPPLGELGRVDKI